MPKLAFLKKQKEDRDVVPFPFQKVKKLLENMENSIMSESSLKKDWLSPEEEEA
ncbi:MAG: hypothetical protein ACTSRI_07855 [Promethearchaeota archaeon]